MGRGFLRDGLVYTASPPGSPAETESKNRISSPEPLSEGVLMEEAVRRSCAECESRNEELPWCVYCERAICERCAADVGCCDQVPARTERANIHALAPLPSHYEQAENALSTQPAMPESRTMSSQMALNWTGQEGATKPIAQPPALREQSQSPVASTTQRTYSRQVKYLSVSAYKGDCCPRAKKISCAGSVCLRCPDHGEHHYGIHD